MTHAVDQRVAQARDDADHATGQATELAALDVSRELRVASLAIELLGRCSPDHTGNKAAEQAMKRLSYLAAELALRGAAREPAEPVMPPAAADIRHAADFPGFGG